VVSFFLRDSKFLSGPPWQSGCQFDHCSVAEYASFGGGPLGTACSSHVSRPTSAPSGAMVIMLCARPNLSSKPIRAIPPTLYRTPHTSHLTPHTSRCKAYDSGSRCFAITFLVGIFTLYRLPAWLVHYRVHEVHLPPKARLFSVASLASSFMATNAS
jgi:hypothetical protein